MIFLFISVAIDFMRVYIKGFRLIAHFIFPSIKLYYEIYIYIYETQMEFMILKKGYQLRWLKKLIINRLENESKKQHYALIV